MNLAVRRSMLAFGCLARRRSVSIGMSSISRSSVHSAGPEGAASDVVRWRSWPLVDHPRWSWAVPVGIVAIGGGVTYLSGTWLAGGGAIAALTTALWPYLLPARYEVSAMGFRRSIFGRTRLVPWHAVRAYRPLSTGIVLYQRPDPTEADALRSLFLPYPVDEDELLCAVRGYLGHAVELS
jgi:hypothetical protein